MFKKCLSCSSEATGTKLDRFLIKLRLVGLVVNVSRERKPVVRFLLGLWGFFRVESYQWLQKLALQWLPCQAPGIIGSALGLVGRVSAYCDWVRWLWSATSILSVAAPKLVSTDPSLRYTSMLLGREPSSQPKTVIWNWSYLIYPVVWLTVGAPLWILQPASSIPQPPRWPSGKASASRAEDPGFESRLRRDFSGVESYQWLKKLALQWIPCQAPDVIGSALGPVGPVSVYCDWVRWKVLVCNFYLSVAAR